MTLADKMFNENKDYKKLSDHEKIKRLEKLVGELTYRSCINEILLYKFFVNNVIDDEDVKKDFQKQINFDEKFLDEKQIADFKEDIKDL